MRIKEVEDLVGITRKNIRFYEKEGLLAPDREQENSYRDYSDTDVRRLRIIKLLRKLDMPISSISDVLDGRISLREALHLQSLMLEEQRCGIVNAQRVCRMIAEDDAKLDTIDTEHYLNEILHAEETGTVLVNLNREDTNKKYRESVLVSAVLLVMLTAFAIFVLVLHRRSGLPIALLYLLAALVLLLFAGVVIALISRVREIRRGEENDLSNY